MVKIKTLGRKEPSSKLKLFDEYTARSGFEQNRLEKKIKEFAKKKNKRVLYRKSRGTNKFEYYVNK